MGGIRNSRGPLATRNLIGPLNPEEVGYDGALFRRGGEEECDYCVIGSGAGGAPVAALLSRAGFRVVILEEGPAVKDRQFPADFWQAAKLLFRDLSMTFAAGRAMLPILQGCCVGGSTTINSAICWRLPEKVWAEWKAIFGPLSPLTDGMLDSAFEMLEKELFVRPTQPEAMGRNNELMEKACRAMGITGRPTQRNERGCKGTGRCIYGCPEGKKLSMENSYVPEAVKCGARLHPLCRAEELLVERGRASGVRGRFIEPRTKRAGASLLVRARKGVVLSAGAIHSPVFLLRNGISKKNAGRHFMCHPGVSVAARFRDEVKMWEGTSQGYETIHYRPQGFKIESLSLPPELLFVRLPGAGARWVRRIQEIPRAALWAVALRAEGKGRVKHGRLGPRISFQFTQRDAGIMLQGVKTLGRMFFAAGAEAVFPGIYGVPEEITRPGDLDGLDTLSPDPKKFLSVATHLFGTCRMGSDPSESVIGPSFECHEMAGLYVTDGSALPTNIGVNPQLTIMAFSAMAAGLLANR